MTNSQEMQIPSNLDRFRLSEESSSPNVTALVSKINCSLAGSNLFCKDAKSEKGNASTNNNDKNIEEILPWLANFNNRCRSAVGSKKKKLFENLLMLYLRNICENVKDSYLKPNRAAKLKESMYETLIFFNLFYKDVKEPLENSYYLDKMSVLVTMYIDMELKASRRRKESGQKLSRKLTTALYVFLDNSIEHILDSILKSKFFTKNFREITAPILGKVLNKVRSGPMHEMLYVRYILAFKLWKKIVADNEVKKKINKIALQQLQPPKNFVDKSKLYSKVLPWIPKSKKNITLFLMQAKFNLKGACQAFLKMVNDTQQSGFSSMLPDKPLYFPNRDGFRFSEYDQIGNEEKGICSLIDAISNSIASSEANSKVSFGQETISTSVGIKRKDAYFDKPIKKKIKKEKDHIPYNSADYKKQKTNDWLNEPDMIKKLASFENKSTILNSNNYKKNKIDNGQFLDQNKLNFEYNIEVKKEPSDINEKHTINNHKLSSIDITLPMNKLIQEKSILKSLHSSNLLPKNRISENILPSKHINDKNINNDETMNSNKEFLYKCSKEQSKKFNKEKKKKYKLNKEKKLKSCSKQKKNKEKEGIKDKSKITPNSKEKIKKKKFSQNQNREDSSEAETTSDIMEIKSIKPHAELINLEDPPQITETKKLIKKELEENSLHNNMDNSLSEKSQLSLYSSPPPSPPIQFNALEKIAQSYDADTPVLSPCEDNSSDTLSCPELIREKTPEFDRYPPMNTPSPTPPPLTPNEREREYIEINKINLDQTISKPEEINLSFIENKKRSHESTFNEINKHNSPSSPNTVSNFPTLIQNEIEIDNIDQSVNNVNNISSNTINNDDNISNIELLNSKSVLVKSPQKVPTLIQISESDSESKKPKSNNDIPISNYSDQVIISETKQTKSQTTIESNDEEAKSKSIKTHVDSFSEKKNLKIKNLISSSPTKNVSTKEKTSTVISSPKTSRPVTLNNDNNLSTDKESNKNSETTPKIHINEDIETFPNFSPSYIYTSEFEIQSSVEILDTPNDISKPPHSPSPTLQTPDSSTPTHNEISITSIEILPHSTNLPTSKNLTNNNVTTNSDELIQLETNIEILPDSSSQNAETQILSDKNSLPVVNINLEKASPCKQISDIPSNVNTSVLKTQRDLKMNVHKQLQSKKNKNMETTNINSDSTTSNKSDIKPISNIIEHSPIKQNIETISQKSADVETMVKTSQELSSHPLIISNKTLKVSLKKLDPSTYTSHSSLSEKEILIQLKNNQTNSQQRQITKEIKSPPKQDNIIPQEVYKQQLPQDLSYSSLKTKEPTLTTTTTTKAALKQHSQENKNEKQDLSKSQERISCVKTPAEMKELSNTSHVNTRREIYNYNENILTRNKLSTPHSQLFPYPNLSLTDETSRPTELTAKQFKTPAEIKELGNTSVNYRKEIHYNQNISMNKGYSNLTPNTAIPSRSSELTIKHLRNTQLKELYNTGLYIESNILPNPIPVEMHQMKNNYNFGENSIMSNINDRVALDLSKPEIHKYKLVPRKLETLLTHQAIEQDKDIRELDDDLAYEARKTTNRVILQDLEQAKEIRELDDELVYEAQKSANRVAIIDQEDSTVDIPGEFNQDFGKIYIDPHGVEAEVEISSAVETETSLPKEDDQSPSTPSESNITECDPSHSDQRRENIVYEEYTLNNPSLERTEIEHQSELRHKSTSSNMPSPDYLLQTPSFLTSTLLPHDPLPPPDMKELENILNDNRYINLNNYSLSLNESEIPDLFKWGPIFFDEDKDSSDRRNLNDMLLFGQEKFEGSKRRSRNFIYNQRYYSLKCKRGFFPDNPTSNKAKTNSTSIINSASSSQIQENIHPMSTNSQPVSNSFPVQSTQDNAIPTYTSNCDEATNNRASTSNRGMCWESNQVKNYPKWQPQNWPQPTVPVNTFNLHHVKCSCRDCTVRTILLNVESSEQIPIPYPIPTQCQTNLSEWAARKSEDERLLKRIEESLFNYNTQEHKDSSLPLKKRIKTMPLEQNDLPSTSKQPTEQLLSYPSTPMISIAELDNSILIKFPQRSNDEIQNNTNQTFPFVIGQPEYYTNPLLNAKHYEFNNSNYTLQNTDQQQNANRLSNNNTNEVYVNINNEYTTNGTYVPNELHSKNPEIIPNNNISNNNPIANTIISNNNPIANTIIANNNPIANTITANNNPIANTITANNNPMANTIIANNNPMANTIIANNNPLANTIISNNSIANNIANNNLIGSNENKINSTHNISPTRATEYAGRQFRTPAQRKEIPPSTRVFNNVALLSQPETNNAKNQSSINLNKIENNYAYSNNAISIEKDALDLSKTKKHKRKHSRRRKSHSDKSSDQGIYKSSSSSKLDDSHQSERKKRKKHESGNR